MTKPFWVVCTEPGPHQEFVECETADSKSVGVGEWEQRSSDGYWQLGPFVVQHDLDEARTVIEGIHTALGPVEVRGPDTDLPQAVMVAREQLDKVRAEVEKAQRVIKGQDEIIERYYAKVERLRELIKEALETNGGPFDEDETIDGKAYMMVRRDVFDRMDAAYQEKYNAAD